LLPQSQRKAHDESLSRYHKTGEKRVIGMGREVVGQRKDLSTFPIYVSVGEGVWNEKTIFVAIIHDLTIMNAELAQREDATRLLAQIVKSSDDAIISKTLDGVITSWNDAAERMFGYRVDEAVGRNVTMLIPTGHQTEEKGILARLKAGDSIQHYETIRRRKDGEELHVSISVAPLRDRLGQIIGASKVVRDITQRKMADFDSQKLQSDLAHAARLNAMDR